MSQVQKTSLKPAHEIYARLIWDKTVAPNGEFTVGYEDVSGRVGQKMWIGEWLDGQKASCMFILLWHGNTEIPGCHGGDEGRI